MSSGPEIAIVSINRHKYSETFIHQHVRLLPMSIHYLYGGYLPDHVTKSVEEEGFPLHSRSGIKSLIWSKNKDKFNEKKQALIRYLLKNKIKVVLAEYGPSGVELMDICQECNIPLIVHFHGYDAYRDDVMQSYGFRYKELFSKARAIIAVSSHMKQHLLSIGVPAEKLYLNPYGPDSKLFTRTTPELNEALFLGVGRFAETKSPFLTILAFRKLLDEYSEAKLLLVGDGHLKESCEILSDSLGLKGSVEFTGALKHAEVASLMQKARAFVQHSITTKSNDTEGTPVAILEACASGLPVISTKHAGIPDVVLDGQNGILVAEGDIEGMAKAMLHLAKNPNAAGQMGAEGRRIVENHFTLERHINELRDIINACID